MSFTDTPLMDTPAATSLLRFATAGSVDDGKSTLVGRLLHVRPVGGCGTGLPQPRTAAPGPGAADRRPARRARAGHHHRRRLPLLRHPAPPVHPGRHTGTCAVRYEDFVREPRAVIGEIARFAGHEDISSIGFDGDSAVVLGTNHTITGNLDRLRQGRVEIKGRESWRDSMSPPGKVAAFAGVAPLMLRYGYRG